MVLLWVLLRVLLVRVLLRRLLWRRGITSKVHRRWLLLLVAPSHVGLLSSIMCLRLELIGVVGGVVVEVLRHAGYGSNRPLMHGLEMRQKLSATTFPQTNDTSRQVSIR